MNNNVSNSVTLTEPGVNATDDNNACTIDGCNTLSGIFHNFVIIEDNDACTLDACNTLPGVISHTPNCLVTLNANIFWQGYYLGTGLMSNCLFLSGVSSDPLDVDSVKISLMNSNAPYATVDEQIGIVKTDGNVTVTFSPSVVIGNLYYIKVTHRNAIETWTALPLLFSQIISYSFSTSASKAFGDNEIITYDSLYYAMYNGDINQDGAIDGSDFLELDPSIQNGDGGYAVGDLNGDGAVDGSDFLVLDPNIQNGIGSNIP